MKFLGRPQSPGVHGAALLFPNNSTLGMSSFKLNWNNDGAALGSSLLGAGSGDDPPDPPCSLGGHRGWKSGVLTYLGWGDTEHMHCSLPPPHAPSLGRNLAPPFAFISFQG